MPTLPIKFPPLCGYRCPGLWWFRVFGWGVCWKRTAQHPLLFSQRSGLRGLTVRGWHFEWLRP